MKKISIVTPSFNQARYLRRTIESVLRQSVDLEYIIVDGCSSDGSVEILNDYRDRAHIIVEKDKGQADAIAKGFSMASGQILAWLNSDDMYVPGALEKLIHEFDKGFEFIYGNLSIIDENDRILRKRVGIPADFNALYYGGYCIPQEATFFSRKLYEECGGLDRNLHYAMDYDLWLRMSHKTFPRYINEFLSCFRYHKQQKSRRLDLYREDISRARSKFVNLYPPSILKTCNYKATLGMRKIYRNIQESGLKKTVFDVSKKVMGKLP